MEKSFSGKTATAKHFNRLINKSFGKTLLDTPVSNFKRQISLRGNIPKLEIIRKLPKPLQPTKYKPTIPKLRLKKPRIKPKTQLKQKPKPKPRIKSKVPIPAQRTKIITNAKALGRAVQTHEVAIIDKKDPARQLDYTKLAITSYLRNIFNKYGAFKANINLNVDFIKPSVEGEPKENNANFNSLDLPIVHPDDIPEFLAKAAEKILSIIAGWISKGSGWVIKEVRGHFINIVKYLPLRGGSHLKLPKKLRNSMKGLINMQNQDDKCFLWCHNRHLYPRKFHPERVTKEDRVNAKELKYNGITFPVTRDQISRIEKQNEINIFVYGFDTAPYPIYPSIYPKKPYRDNLDLLYIEGKDEFGRDTTHYVLIKDLSRFMSHFTKHNGMKYFCRACLQCCYSSNSLAQHMKDCISINGMQASYMPNMIKDKNGNERPSCVYFKNHQYGLPPPFYLVADCEAITERVISCQPSDKKSYTQQYQKHTPCGASYKLICPYDEKYSEPLRIFRGEDCIKQFFDSIYDEVDKCKNIIREHFNKPLFMTHKDDMDFKNATRCHICNRRYHEDDEPVRDHCHVTGKYRGSAHSECNLKWQISADKLKLPVVFHNLKGYDSHFLISELGDFIKRKTLKVYEQDDDGNVVEVEEGYQMKTSVIAQNIEKFMTFTVGNLKFIDSFQFMPSSLDKLATNLSDSDFIYTKKYYTDPEQFYLMKRKGIYPYKYMNSFNKFNETELPPIEAFYSKLKDENISEDDYNHAKNVWKVFGLKNMGEYHDLYLKTDVLLLVDVFQKFRNMCLEYYKLDPLHYISTPGFSWDAMLKMTGINIELLSDKDMYLFIEKGVRGGITHIAHRHAEANNKYMKIYDQLKLISYIMYLDANNLYGWAMSQPLPYGNFKWIETDRVLPKENGKCRIYKVDLEYPEELHDLHNDYPLAPEKIPVTDEMLSPYCRNIKDKFKIKIGNVNKLITNLSDKEEYVIYENTLHLYLKLGLKVKKIHSVLEFSEKPWLKKYIDFNTEKRKKAKNTFEKDFFKLMNNSVYGKTIENVRNHVDVKLETDRDHLLKLAAKPNYNGSTIINENLVAVRMKKHRVLLNKPIYIGMCILDLSKLLMYDFHYNFIKKKYGDLAKLLFGDTDSLCYQIFTDDVYEDFDCHRDLFDNSDYNKDSKYYFDTNKKVIGKMKDEAAGNIITSFVGLKSKMYSYLEEKQDGDIKNNKKAKGITKTVTKKQLTHAHYLACLYNTTISKNKINVIRSNNHQLSTYEINKTSLSCYDDKRYILDDGIRSYAYGHYKITKN